MKKLSLLAALFVATAFSACSRDDAEPIVVPDLPVLPDKQPEELAITFVESNSLQFDVDETKTVHYTITGGSDKTVVKAELQTANDAYTVETTPTSATEGTIAITAKTPETENCVVVTVSDGSQTITAEIVVSTNPIPEELAITFVEGNSLELGVSESKTIHYTITGGSDKTVVTAKMQTPDNAYTVETTPTSATEGTIAITAKLPTENCVIVTVSDGDQSITAEIAVSTKPITITVETPGTLSQLLVDYDQEIITELILIGNLNAKDIAVLKKLPNLSILDMENANLEVLPDRAFKDDKSLTSVKLPKTLTTIGSSAFYDCSSLTSITIPDSVTTIGDYAFQGCKGLTSITIPDGVTEIKSQTFYGCCSLTSVTIPNGVTTIGSSAFFGCRSLTSVTIPDGVTSIGDYAFSGFTGLTSITIPDSVTSIGVNAFQYCSDLKSIYCKAQIPPTIKSDSFYQVATSTPLYVPIGCADAYRAAEYWSRFGNINEMEFE